MESKNKSIYDDFSDATSEESFSIKNIKCCYGCTPHTNKLHTYDWLYNYREDWGVKFSIQNVLNKAKYLDKDIPVFQAFLDNKDILQKCYDNFFPDLLAHAKAENAILQLQK